MISNMNYILKLIYVRNSMKSKNDFCKNQYKIINFNCFKQMEQ